MGSSAAHGPARRTWRRDKDEPGKPNAPAQSHSGRKTKRPTSERSDNGGCGGLCPPAAWHTTARTDNPARAGGSPGAALACPQPALTGPATAALAGRAGTSPRLSPAGAVPVTPLGATLLRPYGTSGRATARSVAGRLPRFRRQPRAAPEPPRGAGRGAKPPWTARSASDPQSPLGGRGERSGAGHATPAVPRTGATAVEASRVPGVPGAMWRKEPAW